MNKLDTYKKLLIGKTVNWLTCVDIIHIENTYFAECICKCGNHTYISASRFSKGKCSKSCGCYRFSKEFSDSQRQFLLDSPDIIEDSIKKTKEWNKNHPELKLVANKKLSEWFSNNPKKVNEKEEKHKLWFINNPDKVKDQSDRCKQFYIDNPNKRLSLSNKLKEYYNENSYKCKLISERMKIWFSNSDNKNLHSINTKLAYKNDPSIAYNRGKKFSEWASKNKDKLKMIAENHSNWANNHKEKIASLARRYSELCKDNRIKADYTELLDIIHPSHINDLLNGNIKPGDLIKTRCPICNEYAEHSFNNVYLIKSGKLKKGRAMICNNCVVAFTSSSYEADIENYIKSFCNFDCIRNSRNIISPFELDLYYPEKKIAIEFNGDYWHSDEFKEHSYHYNKFVQCKELGILLVSIFESAWLNNKQSIESYLRDSFYSIENSLSYDGDYMNNNYPNKTIMFNLLSNTIREDHYTFNNHNVFTCGYTKIRF